MNVCFLMFPASRAIHAHLSSQLQKFYRSWLCKVLEFVSNVKRIFLLGSLVKICEDYSESLAVVDVSHFLHFLIWYRGISFLKWIVLQKSLQCKASIRATFHFSLNVLYFILMLEDSGLDSVWIFCIHLCRRSFLSLFKSLAFGLHLTLLGIFA